MICNSLSIETESIKLVTTEQNYQKNVYEVDVGEDVTNIGRYSFLILCQQKTCNYSTELTMCNNKSLEIGREVLDQGGYSEKLIKKITLTHIHK